MQYCEDAATVFFDKQYKITTGFFSENTIVVAEGEMLLEGVFKVRLFLSWPEAVSDIFVNNLIFFHTPSVLGGFPHWKRLLILLLPSKLYTSLDQLAERGFFWFRSKG